MQKKKLLCKIALRRNLLLKNSTKKIYYAKYQSKLFLFTY